MVVPKVSIIIPIYNVEQYLHECLDSVVAQTLKDIEVICVNDGSTDGSLGILEEYAQKDCRIKVISKPNSGYGHTMNVGLENATGEYIGIVESDDFVKEDMYVSLYSLAKEHDADIIKADFYRFKVNNNGKLILEYNDLSHGKKEYYNRVLDPAENIVIFRFIMNTWSGIYKKAFLDHYHIRHNETPGASFQDNGFFFQTFCQASKIFFVDKPFYMNRRDNPNSSVMSKEKVFCIRDEYQFIREFLERNPEIKKRYMSVYSLKKFHNYIFTYNRIADEHKEMFLAHFSQEFGKAREAGELDENLFTKNEWIKLNNIIDDPKSWYNLNKARPKGIWHKASQLKNKGLIYIVKVIIKKIQRAFRSN